MVVFVTGARARRLYKSIRVPVCSVRGLDPSIAVGERWRVVGGGGGGKAISLLSLAGRPDSRAYLGPIDRLAGNLEVPHLTTHQFTSVPGHPPSSKRS